MEMAIPKKCKSAIHLTLIGDLCFNSTTPQQDVLQYPACYNVSVLIKAVCCVFVLPTDYQSYLQLSHTSLHQISWVYSSHNACNIEPDGFLVYHITLTILSMIILYPIHGYLCNISTRTNHKPPFKHGKYCSSFSDVDTYSFLKLHNVCPFEAVHTAVGQNYVF